MSAFALRECPTCGFVSDEGLQRPVLRVITNDGVSHAVPVAWFTDRRARLEREGVAAVDAVRGAYLAWASTCTVVTA